MYGRPSRGERLRGDRVMISAVTLNQPGPRDASVGFAERLLEGIVRPQHRHLQAGAADRPARPLR